MRRVRQNLNKFVLAVMLAVATALFHSAPVRASSNADLIDGFNKTVFGSEYSSLLSQSYIRKFDGTVRFYVNSKAGPRARASVERFISRLGGLIYGLRVKIVTRRRNANFVVHVVNRRDYASTVRKEVYRSASARVRGRCMVRSVFTRNGISRSDAVIVADEGSALLSRCMTEEILQGLGPLNDDRSLSASMFNDTSRFTSFRRFDRIILNMLYDRDIQIGMSKAEVQPLLPSVLRRVRTRIERLQ